MRAVLIDPAAQAVTEVDCTGERDGPGGIREWVFGPGRSGVLAAVSLGGHHAYVDDDEGLLGDWQAQAFFAAGEHTIAGRALLLADTVDGEEAPATLDLRRVRFGVRWVRPQDVRVPAPRFVGDDGRVELLDGREWWMFEDNPGRRA